MGFIGERIKKVEDPADAAELVAWAQERLTLRDFPAVVSSPWISVIDSEKFLKSAIAQTNGEGWLRSAALYLIRRFRDAVELNRKEAGDGQVD